jgi:hypothetical protein
MKRKAFQAPWISGILLLLAANANAGTISYTTNDAGTGFVDGNTTSLTLNGYYAGAPATITFVPDTTNGAGVPSSVSFGDFVVVCSSCTTQANHSSFAYFTGFTFDLVVSDSSDGATGEFIGTSSGGYVYSDVTEVQVNWQSTSIGAGTLNALTGNFGTTAFDLVSATTALNPGDTTVSGQIVSSTPEPATFALFCGTLFGLGCLGGKKAFRR